MPTETTAKTTSNKNPYSCSLYNESWIHPAKSASTDLEDDKQNDNIEKHFV